MFDKPDYKRHDDDEWIDEVRIITVPRYKTSGLSGDEWRFSAQVQFLRKGHVLYTRPFSKIHYAIDFLPALQHEYADQGLGDQDADDNKVDFDKYCFNPGCKADGVVEYELIDEYIRTYGIKQEKQKWRTSVRRRFCEEHAMRGDCALEDADRNYRLISAPPGWKGNAELGAAAAESPSAQASVVIENLEDLDRGVVPMVDDSKADFQFYDPRLADAMRETLESIAKYQACARKCNCKTPDTCCITLRQFCSKCLAQQTLNMVTEQSSA